MTPAFEKLQKHLKQLPGLGYRSSERIALHLLVEKPAQLAAAERLDRLAHAALSRVQAGQFGGKLRGARVELHRPLQGVRRNTGVAVEELELGIHENPFACADLHQPERRLILDVLDEARYGTSFERFIQIAAGHLA